MGKGWIKLHRRIQDCEFLWDSRNEPFDRRSAWIDILMLANREDRQTVVGGNTVTIKAGQRITSVRRLAERWNWSVNKVRRYLATLEREGMIHKESDNHSTLLTVVNYEVYQGQCNTDEYTDGTQVNTQTEHERIHTRHTNKKERSKEEENKRIYGEYRHVRLTDDEHQKLISDFGETDTREAIRFLDEYIEMKGYKVKSHYLAMRKWVYRAIKEDRAKKKTPMMETGTDYEALMEQIRTGGTQ